MVAASLRNLCSLFNGSSSSASSSACSCITSTGARGSSGSATDLAFATGLDLGAFTEGGGALGPVAGTFAGAGGFALAAGAGASGSYWEHLDPSNHTKLIPL